MNQSERGLNYHIDGVIEGVEDKKGNKGSLVKLHSSPDSPIEDVLKDFEERTGEKWEPVYTIQNGDVGSQFGFSGKWKCPWEPQGPRANWSGTPKKLN